MSSRCFLLLVVLFLGSLEGRMRFLMDKTGEQCRCIARDQCREADDDASLYGHGLLDPRIIDKKCPNPSHVCCPSAPPPPPYQCGSSQMQLTKSRITSGTNVAFGELPWNLLILDRDGEKNLYQCGGTLIHPKVALTAAHCVESYADAPDKLIVRAGEYDLGSREEPFPFQSRLVDEVVIHESYNPASLKNDVALLLLAADFDLVENVAVICLATPSVRIYQNKCFVSGWGKTAFRKGAFSSVLKKVQVPLMEPASCQRSLRATALGPRYKLHESFVCAGGKKHQDSCKGDGGGPLICPLADEDGRFVQIGVVSWGMGCGVEGVPGVYSNVPMFLDWIGSNLKLRALDPEAYTV